MVTERKKPHPRGSLNAAAERLGVSRPTVYKLIREGHLAAYRVGFRLRVDDAAIETYLDACRRAGPLRPAARVERVSA